MNQIRNFLVLLVFQAPLLLVAQDRFELKDFSNHIDSRMNEIHYQLMNSTLREDVSRYWSDSFASQASTPELLERLRANKVPLVDNRIDKSFLDIVKNPAIWFAYSLENDFRSGQLTVQLLGVSPMSKLYASGIDLGLNSFCWLSVEDVRKVLSKEDYDFLLSIQMVTRNEDIFKSIWWDSTELDLASIHLYKNYFNEPLHARVDSNKTSFINIHTEQSLHFALHLLANRLRTEEIALYQDVGLKEVLTKGLWGFQTQFVTQIQNPDKPDDPYDLVDTSIGMPVDLFDHASSFWYHNHSGQHIIEVDLGEAKNEAGNSNFYIRLSNLESLLTEWDYIILKDFIEHNTVK